MINSQKELYQELNLIGQSCASVYYGFRDDNKSEVAIQKIPKDFEDSEQSYNRQVEILQKFHHPNIVKFLDNYEDQEDHIIILQYCEGGTLQNRIEKGGVIPESEAVDIFLQLLSGLQEMHEEKIMHRDIKPDNIFFQDGVAQLGDLGISQLIQRKSNTITGTKTFMAYEVLNQKQYGFQADIYSMGLVLHYMLQGFNAFSEIFCQFQRMGQMREGRIVENPQNPLSNQARDLIYKMLDIQIQNRITIPEIYLHPLIEQHSNHIASEINPIDEQFRNIQKFNQFYLNIDEVPTSILEQIKICNTNIQILCLTKFMMKNQFLYDQLKQNETNNPQISLFQTTMKYQYLVKEIEKKHRKYREIIAKLQEDSLKGQNSQYYQYEEVTNKEYFSEALSFYFNSLCKNLKKYQKQLDTEEENKNIRLHIVLVLDLIAHNNLHKEQSDNKFDAYQYYLEGLSSKKLDDLIKFQLKFCKRNNLLIE